MPILQPRSDLPSSPVRAASAAGRAAGFNPHQAVWARMKALATERPHMAVLYNTEADSINLPEDQKAQVKAAISDLGVNTEGW